MPRTTDGKKQPPTAAVNLIAGGGAGMMEALACHPLDTIKVRMQLSRRARQPGAPKRGFLKTGSEIIKKETPLGLYKGLGAVLTPLCQRWPSVSPPLRPTSNLAFTGGKYEE